MNHSVEEASPAVAMPAGDGSPAAAPTVRLRVALAGVAAALLGAAPHVLHHAGPLAGAALFAGIGGKLLFGVLGLVLAVPMLHKLRRRTGSWAAPAAALALFSVVFLVSTFVIGPALTAGDGESGNQGPAEQAPTPAGHEEHHR